MSGTELIDSWYAAVKRADKDETGRLAAPDVEWVLTDGFALGGHYRSPEAFHEVLDIVLENFDDYHTTQDVMEFDDKVLSIGRCFE